MSDRKETIDQLAEAAELLDRGALLRQHHVDALRDGRELDAQAYREQAWLTFREAEVRVQLSGMTSIRDNATTNAAAADYMKQIADQMHGDEG